MNTRNSEEHKRFKT